MPVPYEDILHPVQTALHDEEGIHWSPDELTGYLNEGQVVIATLRPDEVSQPRQFQPVEGARQTLVYPDFALLAVRRNLNAGQHAITRVSREALEAVRPAWQAESFVDGFVHYMYDPQEPRAFALYPPAPANGPAIELLVAVYPPPVDSLQADGFVMVPDHWATPLRNYVLFRAFSKDVEFGGDTANAQGYLQLFTQMLGVKPEQVVAASPAGAEVAR